MNILVLGGTGMLGHKVFQHLCQRSQGNFCTMRAAKDDEALREIEFLQSPQVVDRFDATDFVALERFLLQHRPRVVINCVGVIKQRPEATVALPSIMLNSLLSHFLAEMCKRWGGRLIHFSTDCVFSGNSGRYRENDFADANDLYGRTKFLGEVATKNALTLRTSIIGREIWHFTSLLEWFLSQNHAKVRGFRKVFFSGVTTNWLAEVVAKLIENDDGLSGLYQVASQKISKFDLLCLLRQSYDLDIEIAPDEELRCDRSMVGEKFAQATGYLCPTWPELVAQLAKDHTPYEKWRTFKHEAV